MKNKSVINATHKSAVLVSDYHLTCVISTPAYSPNDLLVVSVLLIYPYLAEHFNDVR